jgi:hypothetical protein
MKALLLPHSEGYLCITYMNRVHGCKLFFLDLPSLGIISEPAFPVFAVVAAFGDFNYYIF